MRLYTTRPYRSEPLVISVKNRAVKFIIMMIIYQNPICDVMFLDLLCKVCNLLQIKDIVSWKYGGVNS